MMKPSPVEKFLQGKADDRETRQAEELLSHGETVSIAPAESTEEDSLLVALRTDSQSHDNADAVRKLTEQLERLLPRPEISSDEIRQLLAHSDNPQALGEIGKYRVTQYLAGGGMGLVFRATDGQLDRDVCIKLLHPLRAGNADARSRFERETRSIARLNCERIMPILDIGVHRDLPFLVMPLLEGVSLRTLLLHEGRLAANRATRIAMQIAEALEFSHQLQILHRDIKPDNLWITPNDDVKLLDFGLARTSEESTPITHEGTVLGTPSYMSPEQVTGKPLDGRSDLFSLGVVMVEMLTGRSPFRKDNLFSTLMSVAADEVEIEELDPDGNIPDGLRKVIQRLLHKNPDQRPESARDVVVALQALMDNPSTSEGIVALRPANNGTSRRSRWSMLAAALGGFAVCMAALALWQAGDKGTLVVESGDPQVEVNIVGEQVSVRDPLTNRTYEIRIGATPLPSGVYQLEMSDGASDLVFSSQTIAIRRGERTIVKVELRPPNVIAHSPPAQVLDDSEEQATDDLSTSFIPPLKAVPPDQIVDQSFSPEVRDRFAEILSSMPALPLDEHLLADRLAAHATVTKPLMQDKLGVWSLEVCPTASEWTGNCDDSLFAAIKGGLVWIVDANGSPQYALPSAGVPVRFAFDNRCPNLIAACSWLGKPAIGRNVGEDENPQYEYRLHVWRLGKEGAELIRSVDSSSYQMAWDQGYRLIHVQDDEFVASRLDTGKTHPLTKRLDNFLIDESVSPGGRFLATMNISGDQGITNVHDLHTGKFVSAIRLSGFTQWHCADAALAVTSDWRDVLEIWRSDQPELLKRINLPKSVDPRTLTRNSLPVLNRDFSLMAHIGSKSGLTIRSLETQREATVESFQVETSASLQWLADGSLQIRGKDNVFVWRSADSEVHGTLSASDSVRPRRQVKPTAAKPARVLAVRGPSMFVTDAEVNTEFSRGTNLSDHNEAAKTRIWHYLHADLGTPNVSAREYSAGESASFSPDGRFYVTSKPSERKLTEATIVLTDIESGIETLSLPTHRSFPNSRNPGGLQSEPAIAYSFDSRNVLISQRARPSNVVSHGIFETASGAQVEFNHPDLAVTLGGPPNDASCLPWRDGFIAQTRPTDGNSAESELWYFQPSTGQVFVIESDISELESYRLAFACGDFLFFYASTDSEAQRAFTRAQFVDEKLTNLQRLDLDIASHVEPSPDGRFFQAIVYAPESVKVTTAANDRRTINLSNLDQFPASVFVATWPEGDQHLKDVKPIVSWKTPVPTLMTWHADSQHLASLEDSSHSLFVLDLQSTNWQTITSASLAERSASVHPTDFGWLLAASDRLWALDHSGQQLATFLITQEGDMKDGDTKESGAYDGRPLDSGCWVLADGTRVAGEIPDALQLVRRDERRVVVEAVQAFVDDSSNPRLPQTKELSFLP